MSFIPQSRILRMSINSTLNVMMEALGKFDLEQESKFVPIFNGPIIDLSDWWLGNSDSIRTWLKGLEYVFVRSTPRNWRDFDWADVEELFKPLDNEPGCATVHAISVLELLMLLSSKSDLFGILRTREISEPVLPVSVPVKVPRTIARDSKGRFTKEFVGVIHPEGILWLPI